MAVSKTNAEENSIPASLFRRLAANCYDLLVIICLWIAATFLVLPITHGAAIAPSNRSYQIYLLLITAAYYVGSWYYYQQTIGMRAWRIILVSKDESSMSLGTLMLRFIHASLSYSCAGFGVWWSVFDKEKQAFHDKNSGTKLIVRDAVIPNPTS